MSDSPSPDRAGQITGWILAIVAAAGAAFLASRWDEQRARTEHRQAERVLDRAAREARAAAGPFIESRKMLDPTTELVTIRAPDPQFADPFLDVTCFVYRDLPSGAAAMACPDILDARQ